MSDNEKKELRKQRRTTKKLVGLGILVFVILALVWFAQGFGFLSIPLLVILVLLLPMFLFFSLAMFLLAIPMMLLAFTLLFFTASSSSGGFLYSFFKYIGDDRDRSVVVYERHTDSRVWHNDGDGSDEDGNSDEDERVIDIQGS